METVTVSTPRVMYTNVNDCGPCNKKIITQPRDYERTVTYRAPEVVRYSEPVEVPGPDCCNPIEIEKPLKRTCLFMSQTPVLLFLILLTLFYIISCLYCWNTQENCEGDQCESSQKWTAFAVNTIIYVLLAILMSMWIYRLAQYQQSRSLGLAVAIIVPFATWIFFGKINSLVMCTESNTW